MGGGGGWETMSGRAGKRSGTRASLCRRDLSLPEEKKEEKKKERKKLCGPLHPGVPLRRGGERVVVAMDTWVKRNRPVATRRANPQVPPQPGPPQ